LRLGGQARSLIIVLGIVSAHILGVILFSPSTWIAPGLTAICLFSAILLSPERDLLQLFARARIYVAAVAALCLS